MEQLFWSKNLFGNKLSLSRGQDPIGHIVWDNFFSSRAHATINGRRFFLNREFMLSKIEIYDSSNQALLGSIMVNLFNPRSDVVINGKRFELEIKNFWQSRWSWKFNGAEIITYQSNELLSHDKGIIELFTTCNEEVEILLLIGLFVRNQFVLFMILLIIIFLLVII
jgi:hypothetical protein